MASKEYSVFIVQYSKQDQKTVEDLISGITKIIDSKHGKIQRVYRGSEKRIVSAIQSILQLAE